MLLLTHQNKIIFTQTIPRQLKPNLNTQIATSYDSSTLQNNNARHLNFNFYRFLLASNEHFTFYFEKVICSLNFMFSFVIQQSNFFIRVFKGFVNVLFRTLHRHAKYLTGSESFKKEFEIFSPPKNENNRPNTKSQRRAQYLGRMYLSVLFFIIRRSKNDDFVCFIDTGSSS